MDNQNKKLANVKKSCKIAAIVSKVFTIIFIVATVLCIVGAIFSFLVKDPILSQALANDNIQATLNSGIFQLESSIPALNAKFQDFAPTIVLGFYILIIGASMAVMAGVMALIGSIFSLINKEESPFSDKVVTRLLVAMIVISTGILMSSGVGFGVLAYFITWVIYTIMDYGRALQIQSDETL